MVGGLNFLFAAIAIVYVIYWALKVESAERRGKKDAIHRGLIGVRQAHEPKTKKARKKFSMSEEQLLRFKLTSICGCSFETHPPILEAGINLGRTSGHRPDPHKTKEYKQIQKEHVASQDPLVTEMRKQARDWVPGLLRYSTDTKNPT